MGSVKVVKNCETQVLLPWYGVILKSDNRDIELEFIDSNISTIKTNDPDTNEMITVHEVIFTVKCDGQARPGTHTELIKGMDNSTQEEIFLAARNQISGS